MSPVSHSLWLVALTILVLAAGGLAVAAFVATSDARDKMHAAADDADRAVSKADDARERVRLVETRLSGDDAPSTGRHGKVVR